MWMSMSRAIVNALTMLSTVVLAWFLVPADFGLVALGTTMLAIVTGATELSLTQALIRHENPRDSHFNAAWTLNTIRGLIIFLLFALAAYPAAKFYGDTRLTGIMLALGFSVFLSGLINPRLITFQRQLIFKQEFFLSVSQKFVGLLASVVVAATWHSYWALVVGIVATQLTNVVVSYAIFPYSPKITFQHFKDFFSFSAWLSASQIANTLNWRFDILLIGKILGATPLGYYSMGNNLAILPTRETTAPLKQTIYPSFANIRHDPNRLAAAYQRAQALVTAIALPVGVGFAVVAEKLVVLVLGEIWLPVVFIIQALAAVFAVQTIGSLVQPLGMAQGETKMLFKRDMQMFVVRVPIILLSAMQFGLNGVICCRILTGLLSTYINLILVKRFIGVTVFQQLYANTRALVSAALMATGVIAISSYFPIATGKLETFAQLAAQIVIGAVLYCGVNFTLWYLMNKPQGPETEIIAILSQISSKLRNRVLS
ncbi:lipopolysaccharide biosynthesis protein [Pigmentiphaga daeguensis]